jgi:DNA-binding response OmpR family regulator
MTRSTLVVEDEPDIAMLIERSLRDLSCCVKVAFDGEAGLHAAQSGTYDLIILDRMLPEIDGVAIARRLRAELNHTPILMLTARAGDNERMSGLESGADDYLTEPFEIGQLEACVHALFRRTAELTSARAAPAVIRVGELAIDASMRQVTLRDEPVALTSKEFDLLLHFALNAGRVYTRAELLETLWGQAYDRCEYAVNRHISRLRSKIEEDHANPRYLLSIRGMGYMFGDGGARKRR